MALPLISFIFVDLFLMDYSNLYLRDTGLEVKYSIICIKWLNNDLKTDIFIFKIV